MPEIAPLENGRLTENVVHFARALRRAGVPVAANRAVEAARALASIQLDRRDDFHAVLQACLISRPEHRAAFDAVFKLFWRNPELLEKMMSVLMRETVAPPEQRKPDAAELRAEQALTEEAPRPEAPPVSEDEEIEIDARLTMARDETLRARDFEQMSTEELREATRAIAQLRLPAPMRLSRRARPDPGGPRADWRATLRRSLRQGGDIQTLARRAPQRRPLDLVALCDISGSMSVYSRMLLHFLHALANQPAGARGWAKTHCFVFGTRLTNITRHLARRDVDDALAAAGAEALDWDGGTRIGAALGAFNRLWSRRVMAQGAAVLLITDGLDRDDADRLAAEAERLRLTASKVIWLNPLLRWDGFTPKASGVRALLPQVDSFRAAHNIDSLTALVAALSQPGDDGERARLMALMSETRDAAT